MKFILKLFLLVLFVFATSSLYAQNCKFDEDKKDPFTNETIRSLGLFIGDPTWNWSLTISQKNDKLTLTLRVILEGNINEIYPRGRKFLIKLEDGHVIEIENEKDSQPAQVAALNGIWTNFFPMGEIDDVVLKHLRESPIVAVKATIGDKDYLVPNITGKQTKKIMRAAECFLDVMRDDKPRDKD